MPKMLQKRKLLATIVGITMVLVLLFGTIVTMTYAEEDNNDDFSFYRIASAAAAYYDDTHNAASENAGKFDGDKGVTPGNAGGLVGFLDEDYSDGFFGATVSYLSSSSQAHSYGSYSENQSIQAYAVYGRMLSELGLDSTAYKSLDIAAIGRAITGFFMLCAFWLAVAVDAIFSGLVSILQFFNPFSFFGKVATAGFVQDAFGSVGAGGALSGLVTFVSKIYDVFYDIGWTITIPFLFLYFMFFFVFSKVSGSGSQSETPRRKFRKLVTRTAFLVIGIPLLGTLYTATLNSITATKVENSYTTNGLPATKTGGSPIENGIINVIASTFVDFETWARNTHLDLPPGRTLTMEVTSKTPSGVLSRDTEQIDIRELVREINGDAIGASKMTVPTMSNVIMRYMSSGMYYSSDFETEQKRAAGRANSKSFYQSLKTMTDIKNYYDKTLFTSPVVEGSDNGSSSDVRSITMTGGLKCTVNGGKFSFTGNGGTFTLPLFGHNLSIDMSGAKGLSTLAMYNYLTTSFDETSFVVYSSRKATGDFFVKTHRSVNIAGTGIFSVFNYLNALTMLIVTITVGTAYGFAMFFNTLRRGFRIIASMPFTMMGSLKAMAQFTTYSFMLIIEILGTVFTYFLVMELLYNSVHIFTQPIRDWLTNKDGASGVDLVNPALSASPLSGTPMAGLLSMSMLNLIILIINIVFLIWFTKWAMKLRKQIIQTVDEFFAQQIDKFFCTMDSAGGGAGQGVLAAANAPKQPGMLRKAAGAVGAGAGMAAGQALTKGATGMIGDKLGIGGQKEEGAGGATNPTADAESAGADASKNTIEGGEKQGLPGDNTAKKDIKDDVTSEGKPKALEAATGASNGEAKSAAMERPAAATADSNAKSAEDARAQAKMDEMTGKTSAIEAEKNAETARQMAKEQKQQAKAEKAGAAVDTAKGVAKGAAAYATGDVAMGGQAIKETSDGLAKGVKADKKARSANKDAQTATAQAQNQANAQKKVSGSKSAGGSAQTEKNARNQKQSNDRARDVKAQKQDAGRQAAVNTVASVSGKAGAVSGSAAGVSGGSSAALKQPKGSSGGMNSPAKQVFGGSGGGQSNSRNVGSGRPVHNSKISTGPTNLNVKGGDNKTFGKSVSQNAQINNSLSRSQQNISKTQNVKATKQQSQQNINKQIMQGQKTVVNKQTTVGGGGYASFNGKSGNQGTQKSHTTNNTVNHNKTQTTNQFNFRKDREPAMVSGKSLSQDDSNDDYL